MRPYILAESNWKYIRDAEIELAILPWGATEAHNYHLPYGTDIVEAERIASEAARIAWERGARPTVLPVIPFGVNTGQSDIRLDINMNPSTQFAVLRDIIEVLNRQNILKLLILNSHGGNDFRTMLRELGLTYPKMFLSSCNWFQSLPKANYFEHAGDHADEMETSLMLHLAPELVLPLSEAGDGKEKKNRLKPFREGWAWAERRWSRISADTGVGFPGASTGEKGERFFTDVCEKMSGLIFDLCKTDVDDLYE